MLKVLTLNLHKGFSHFRRRFVLHELRDAIRDISAEIVFLQEVIGEHSEHSSRHRNWPQQSQYEFLADSIWQSYAYGKNAVYTEGHHGNAILCKYPIVEHDNYDISISGAEKRGVLHVVIDVPGIAGRLHALCAHMGLTEPHREEQLTRLCDFVNDGIPPDVPVVLAGDFNDWRCRATPLLGHRAGFTEAFHAMHGKSARSFPARLPLLRLDRIYTRHLETRNTEVLKRRPWSYLSDHAALTAELAFV